MPPSRPKASASSSTLSPDELIRLLDALPVPRSKAERIQEALEPLLDAIKRNVDRGVPLKDVATLLSQQLDMRISAVDVGVAIGRRKQEPKMRKTGAAS